MKPPAKATDAFGREILAHFRGNGGHEIVERDDGFAEPTNGPAAYFAEFAQWPAFEQRAMRFAHGRVLDVGAGAGRVALHLQRRRLAVTAIDNSALALKVCRARGVKRTLLRPIEDIGRFPKGAFDTIVMFGNNFGLFGSRAKARRLLTAMHRISSDDALIIAQTLDPRETTDPVHRAYHRRNLARGRMAGQIRLRVRFRNYVGPWFDYLFVTRDEMRSIVAGTGWRIREFVDGDGPCYVAVIVKDRAG
ncbi:MAG: class I SAM-dependent methyltransferase [Planctomycetes bacterium]|nr:class I SAM-dependent methyltransferase [Planctomycetota bacterium]